MDASIAPLWTDDVLKCFYKYLCAQDFSTTVDPDRRIYSVGWNVAYYQMCEEIGQDTGATLRAYYDRRDGSWRAYCRAIRDLIYARGLYNHASPKKHWNMAYMHETRNAPLPSDLKTDPIYGHYSRRE